MRVLQLLALVVAGGLAGACSREGSKSLEGAPVSGSVAVSPAPGTTGVQRNAAVAVQFDYPMDSASCANRFAVHMGDSSGVTVPGRMMWDSTYRHMTFVPVTMMAPGTRYVVTMRDGMMTHGSMMSGDARGMGGGGMMGGTGGGQQRMAGSPMMFDHAPSGAMRAGAGMVWFFTTGT
jgi:hypothetical protein